MHTVLIRASLTAFVLFFYQSIMAQGDLLITPKRIVFDGTKRVEEINLANIGTDTASYTISFVQYKMMEDGKFVPLPDGDTSVKLAHKNLRFFPRSVRLAPKEAQSVKVQLIKTNELAPGEYRSHLYFRALPKNTALGEEESKPEDSAALSIKLTPIFGISIPTIIRVGSTSVQSSFSNAQINRKNPDQVFALANLNRVGNISSYGDITVLYFGADNKPITVCYMRGLAVYTPLDTRKLQLPLSKQPGVDFTRGKLQILYTDHAPKPQIICQTEILL